MHAFDIAGAYDGEAHRNFAGELGLVAKRLFVAAADLWEVLADLLAHHERVDVAVIACLDLGRSKESLQRNHDGEGH